MDCSCLGEIIIPGLDLRKAEITELQYRTMNSRMIIYRFCFWMNLGINQDSIEK